MTDDNNECTCKSISIEEQLICPVHMMTSGIAPNEFITTGIDPVNIVRAMSSAGHLEEDVIKN